MLRLHIVLYSSHASTLMVLQFSERVHCTVQALSALDEHEGHLQMRRCFTCLETATFSAASLAQSVCSIHQLEKRLLYPLQCKFVTSKVRKRHPRQQDTISNPLEMLC